MADDNEINEADDQERGEATPQDGAEPDTSTPEERMHEDGADPAAGDDPATAEPDGGDRMEWATPPELVRDHNRAEIGRLVLHFDHRDVEVLLDGDTGIRALDAIRRLDTTGGDRLSVYTATAENIWFVFHPSDVLAATWIPGVPRRQVGIALDPPPFRSERTASPTADPEPSPSA